MFQRPTAKKYAENVDNLTNKLRRKDGIIIT